MLICSSWFSCRLDIGSLTLFKLVVFLDSLTPADLRAQAWGWLRWIIEHVAATRHLHFSRQPRNMVHCPMSFWLFWGANGAASLTLLQPAFTYWVSSSNQWEEHRWNGVILTVPNSIAACDLGTSVLVAKQNLPFFLVKKKNLQMIAAFSSISCLAQSLVAPWFPILWTKAPST